jgi:hypothetical protein
MLKYIIKVKKPELLVVTPLYTGHKISRDVKINLKRNNVDFNWISYESVYNTARNFAEGISAYLLDNPEPKYVMMVDRDIIPSRHMLDKMLETLEQSDSAYCYCNFEFVGVVNRKFYNIQFDPMKLLNHNYISSNSMIKYDKLKEIGGIVVDDKYKRLLDWALWLKFLNHGYYGVLCDGTSFVALANEKSISAGTDEEYKLKVQLIKEDFIKPLLDGVVF